MSPNIVHIYAVHNDYEMLVYKSESFFHTEASAILSLARPIPALLTNLTILPLHSLPDWRWVRIFSLLTLLVGATQLLWICVRRLYIGKLPAVAIACATFLGVPYIYSVLQPAAWAPHLLTTLFALWGYSNLSRSNMMALAFIAPVERSAWGSLWRQALMYATDRYVLFGCLGMQLALYGYPPNALVIVIPTIACILFSTAPRSVALLIALRDLVFVVVNLAVYSIFTKLVFIPIVRQLIYRNSDEWRHSNLTPFDARVAQNYVYSFNMNVAEALGRLQHVFRVAADLWFFPQWRFHLVTGAALLMALLLANVVKRPNATGEFRLGGALLCQRSWRGMLGTFGVILVAGAVAGAPVFASGGGFVTYRTIPAATAIAGLVFLYSAAVIAEAVWDAFGNPFRARSLVRSGAMVAVVAAAAFGNFEANETSMQLSRNEFAYFKDIVRRAMVDKSRTIVVIDKRPLMLPEDNPVVADRQGRPVVPYELGCLSSYCLQTGAIVRIAAAELGWQTAQDDVQIVRAEYPVAGLTCDMLAANQLAYPPGASPREIEYVKKLRGLRPLTCVMFSLDWHDLSRRLDP